MKKLVLLFISLFLTAQSIKAQAVVLDTNGVTIKWTGTTRPNPYFIQASPRGTLEWFAIVDNITKSNITDYARNSQPGITYFTRPGSSTPIPFNNIITTLVTNMTNMFYNANNFNQPIGSWNVINVTDMSGMFLNATAFNQTIGTWNVSNVTNMSIMFYNANSFNQFIGTWNVSNVNYMNAMFLNAYAFNQPIGSWNVSNVTDMGNMFYHSTAFNQPIGSWNVSNVINMVQMFNYATSFNQPIGTWNVINVRNMSSMFNDATLFNQPIGSWNVINVNDMSGMFVRASEFNQNIESWNVSNATNMNIMFLSAGLSTVNYDALLIGWSTISPNETPLQPNVTFSGGNSKYCNGASARSSIISNYGWTITDAGQDSNCVLETETFVTNSIKLYPNPALSVLNIKADFNLINQPFTINDGLGRVVLKGKLNEFDATINVEQLSKGIYYLKISDNNSSKFIKE